MTKEEWGTKRLCTATGKRFYDLNRDPIVSPYTGEVVVVDTGNKSRPLLTPKAKAKPETTSEEEEVVLEDEEEDTADLDIADDVLEDEEEDNVPLDDIADVASDDDEN